MTRRYRHPITVQPETPAQGSPRRLMWRGQLYHVRQILATWHLRDRWWVGAETGAEVERESRSAADQGAGAADVPSAASTGAASDRSYFRLACREGLHCDVYYDAAQAVWILDAVHD